MSQSVIQLRCLLSGNCVVALDTNVLKALEDEPLPKWFGQFAEMREAGVKFSIPELCVGERLNRFEHAEARCLKNMKEEWYRIVSHLDDIIWHDLPCLPLRGDLYDLVGIQEQDKEHVRDKPFSVERRLRHRIEVVRKMFEKNRTVHLTMVTPEGVSQNANRWDVQSEVKLHDLFRGL